MPLLDTSALTPFDALISQMREYLYIPDPVPFIAAFGALTANMLVGDPCWLMIVGPPGDGKSEILNSLLGVGQVYEEASIKGEASFLSGTGKKDRAKDATGGILRKVSRHGAVIFNDFTSVLGRNMNDRREILDVLKEIYSGRWTRSVGSDGGRSMHWTGKIALLAGCTHEIDQHAAVITAMGERWVYYRTRSTDSDGFNKSMRAIGNATNAVWRDELRGLVADYFTEQGLEFGVAQERRPLETAESMRLIAMAQVISRVRSTVVRDSYSKEIVSTASKEGPTRLSVTLGQLLVGIERLGVDTERAWQTVGRVALDTLPPRREVVIRAIGGDRGSAGAWRPDGGEDRTATIEEISEIAKISKAVVRRDVEDLQRLGVVEVEQESMDNGALRNRVKLTEWVKEDLRVGWRG